MSAPDPVKRDPNRRDLFRTVEKADQVGSEGEAPARRRRAQILKCSYRSPDANFFCWKYGVWYNLMDCCYRHDRRTFPGCTKCGQGEGNLKANRERYVLARHPGDPPKRLAR
jgi:hypothetical protein